MRVRFASLLLLVLASGVGAQDRQAPVPESPAELRRLAAEQLQRFDCQTELPGEQRGGTGSGDDSRERPAGARELPRDRSDGGGLRVHLGGGSAGLAEVLFWLLLAGIVTVVLVAVMRYVGDRSLPLPGAAKVHAAPAAAPTAVPEVVPDHVLLARAGRFAEAIHALLLAALQLLVQRLGRGLPREATGRDAVALAQAVAQSTGLVALVRSVEHSRFGGIAAGVADYDAAVRHFQHWSEACRSPRT